MNPGHLDLFQPQPTASDLIELKAELHLSAARMADLFGLGDGRRWRELESGARRMDAARWSLGLLALGRHPTHQASRIEEFENHHHFGSGC